MTPFLCTVGTLGLFACFVWAILCFIKHKPKKKAGMGILIFLAMLYAGGSQTPDDAAVDVGGGAGRKDLTEETTEPFEVMIKATADDDQGTPAFTIVTNLPDETELMLTLSNDAYFSAQSKIVIENGMATSEIFSEHSKPLFGEYTLSVSMSLPKFQTDAVKEIIGENGEYMTGQYVESAEISDASVVKAEFPFVFRAETMEKQQVELKLKEIIETSCGHTSIDRISVQEKGNGYAVAIALSWDQEKSPDETKEFIAISSEELSRKMEESLPDIGACSISWAVPYYSEYAAISYSYNRSESGMEQTDCTIDESICEETYQAFVREAEAKAAAGAAEAEKAADSNSGSGGNASNFNTYDIDYQTSADYVLNTSTHKFHNPSCSSVSKIAPGNFATSNSARDSLISQGYDPCGRCEP